MSTNHTARHGPSLALRRFIIAALLVAGALGLLMVARPVALAGPLALTSDVTRQVISDTLAVDEPPPYHLRLPVIANNYAEITPVVGVQTYGTFNGSTAPLAPIISSKTTWVRNQFFWNSIEPDNRTPANYNWAGLDAQMQLVRDSKVNLIFTIISFPEWATESGVREDCNSLKNPNDLVEFVSALVARYPYVRFWELCNEPDRVGRFGTKGAQYANLLKAIYPAVKAANPTANVVMGGLALDWFVDEGGPFDRYFLTDVLANCSGTCFDIANFHYYPLYRYRWEPYGRDIVGKANWIRQQLIQYNYARPIIVTETTWPSASSWGSPELQARFVAKSYARGMAAGLLLVTWYSLVDVDTSLPGLLDANHTPRSAFAALTTFTGLMNKARFRRAIPAAETGSARVEAYEFRVPGVGGEKRLDIYWYDCTSMLDTPFPADCTGSAQISIVAEQVARTDKLGSRTVINDQDDGANDGRVRLTIQSSPIYIDYQP